jgi:hypothetical protein
MRIFKHPIKKLTLLAALGGGYVLGARAGRERYEQIKQTANQVKDDPRVQEAASRAEDLVRDAATKVTEDPRVKDVVSRAEDIVRDAGLHTGDSAAEGDKPADDDSTAAADSTDSGSAPAEDVAGDPDAAARLRDVAQASGIAESDDTVNPLLADEHIGLEEEIVYSSGPDIEESIDQLADLDDVEQDITDDERDRRTDS